MKRFFQKRLVDQRRHYRPFFGKVSAISEYSQEAFFLEFVFAEVRNSGLQDCSIRKKRDSFAKIFFGFSKFQNILSFLSTSRMYQSGCRFVDYIRATLLHTPLDMLFFDNFSKFSVLLFQKTLMKSYVMELSRVLGCRLQTY